MPRRGENIYKRKDGRWEGRLLRGYHPNGKAIYQYVYGKSYTEAKCKLLDLRSRSNVEADTVSQRVKYKDILNDWLSMSQIRTKESTFSHYTHLSKLHILPFLGEVPIEHLTRKIVEEHILMLLASGRADGTGGLLSENLASFRAKAGITQAELSNLIGVSRQTYNAIESGQRVMSWNTYLSLLLFFDTNNATRSMLRSLNVYPKELMIKMCGV